MKTFTAKQFSRTPGVVFDAARDDGKVEVTHDRFKGKFQVYYMPDGQHELEVNDVIRINGQQFRVVPWKEKGPELKTKHDIDTALTGAMGKDAHLAAMKIACGEGNENS